MKSLAKIFGVAGLCVIAACSPESEVHITQESYSDLLGEPDFSYRLFPYVNKETGQPTGNFALLVMEAHTVNKNAFDLEGNRGTQTCGAFRTIDSIVNGNGQIAIEYFGSVGIRYARRPACRRSLSGNRHHGLAPGAPAQHCCREYAHQRLIFHAQSKPNTPV